MICKICKQLGMELKKGKDDSWEDIDEELLHNR